MPNISQILPNSDILRNVQILVVDNDFDSRCLCKILFESCGAKVLTVEFIADSLILLNHFLPDILVCEIRFQNEDIWPLIRRVRTIALDRDRTIPILAASAYCSANFAPDIMGEMESHLLKPVDIDSLVDEVWDLVYLSKAFCHTNIQDWVANHKIWKGSTFWRTQPVSEKNFA